MIQTILSRPALACLVMLFSIGLAEAGQINWDKYMTSAANVAAIAAALSIVDNCSKPLQISETREGDTLRLVFNCQGSEDEEAASIVEFSVFGDAIIPKRFDIAG